MTLNMNINKLYYLLKIAEEDLSLFFDGTTISTSSIPDKIKDIPNSLSSLAKSMGRADIFFTSNGITRELNETLQGGPARDKGSIHALGQAHDLIIHTSKLKEEYNIGKNGKILTLDPQVAIIMAEFANKSGLIWGGTFKRGNAYSINNMTVYDMELHHFEMPSKNIFNSLPSGLATIIRNNFDPKIVETSSGRQELYKFFIEKLKNKNYKNSQTKPIDSPQTEIEQQPEEQYQSLENKNKTDMDGYSLLESLFGLKK